jgi:hypothetical protein
MDERELRLNSLRLDKQSSRLVLEEHSHCEIPAGCGGVVLRWRRRSSIPVLLWLHVAGEVQAFLDGAAQASARPLVEPGEHVLALRIASAAPASGAGFLVVAGVHDPTARATFAQPKDMVVLFRTAPDGTWRFTTSGPRDESWTQPGFDDSGWRAMVARPLASTDEAGSKYRLDRLEKLGAGPLGIDERVSPIWVRRKFAIPPELADRDPSSSGQQGG